MAVTTRVLGQPYRGMGVRLSQSWRARGAVGLILLAAVGGVLAARLVVSGVPASPATVTTRLTVGELLPALRRTATAPSQVDLELTYAAPIFFELSGQEAPPRGSLLFLLQEDTHIYAL